MDLIANTRHLPSVQRRVRHSKKEVRTVRGIKKGKKYWMCRLGWRLEITVTSDPYHHDELGDLVADCIIHHPGFDREDTIFLADRGIVPYENGRWNTGNWLERLK